MAQLTEQLHKSDAQLTEHLHKSEAQLRQKENALQVICGLSSLCFFLVLFGIFLRAVENFAKKN